MFASFHKSTLIHRPAAGIPVSYFGNAAAGGYFYCSYNWDG